MKPYAKTFRESKVHKAKDCGVCAERVGQISSPMRREAKKQCQTPEDELPEHLYLALYQAGMLESQE